MIRATIAAIAAYTAVSLTGTAAPTNTTEETVHAPIGEPQFFSSPVELQDFSAQDMNARIAAIEHDHEPAPTHDGESRVSSSVPVLHSAPRDSLALVTTNSGGTQIVELEGPARVTTRPTTVAPVGEPWAGVDGTGYVSEGGNRDFARAGTDAAAEAVAEANKPKPVVVSQPVVTKSVASQNPVVVSQPVIVQPAPRVERSVCRQRSGCPNGVCPRRSVVRRRLFRRW